MNIMEYEMCILLLHTRNSIVKACEQEDIWHNKENTIYEVKNTKFGRLILKKISENVL